MIKFEKAENSKTMLLVFITTFYILAFPSAPVGFMDIVFTLLLSTVGYGLYQTEIVDEKGLFHEEAKAIESIPFFTNFVSTFDRLLLLLAKVMTFTLPFAAVVNTIVA
ncbi:hypothetical protein [Pseudoalteromonas phage J2-1_QLiu-2017]|nr:hypothetical protein [Pseudoalteromonas phage J2-1_QLiu-2017]